MKKSYEDFLGRPISEKQALEQANYSIIYKENGELRLKEKFLDGEFFLTEYYKKPNQDIADAMLEVYTPGKMVVIIESSIISNYRFDKEYIHDREGVFIERSNVLYNTQGDLIAHDYICDLITEIPEYENTRKFYYDRSLVQNHCVFDCIYNVDGTLYQLYYYNYEFDPDGQESFVLTSTPEDITTLMEFTGMSRALAEYYMSPDVKPNF